MTHQVRLDAVERGAPPAAPCRARRRGRAARLRLRVDLRPLPSRGSTSKATPPSSGRCSERSPSAPASIGVAVGVTCPTTRIHPVILAQATATVANLHARVGSPGASAPARRSTSTSPAFAGRRHRSVWSNSKRRSRSIREAVERGIGRPRRHVLLRRGRADLRPAATASDPDRRVGIRPGGGEGGGALRRRAVDHGISGRVRSTNWQKRRR